MRFSFGDKTPKLGFYSGKLMENSLELQINFTKLGLLLIEDVG
jgi:hypothetical protein